MNSKPVSQTERIPGSLDQDCSATIRTHRYTDGGFLATITLGKYWEMLAGGEWGFESRHLARKAAAQRISEIQSQNVPDQRPGEPPKTL